MVTKVLKYLLLLTVSGAFQRLLPSGLLLHPCFEHRVHNREDEGSRKSAKQNSGNALNRTQ